jgi:pilus assembly protein CpaB
MAAKPKTFVIIVVLAIAVAAFASFSLYKYLKGQEARVKEAVATGKVAVASREISVGSSIRSDQVRLTDWPRASMPQGSFSSADQVVGRVTLDSIAPDEPIVEAKLVPREGQAGVLIYRIPSGHRAITVGVDQVAGVAGFVTPGSRVDVVLTVSPGSGASVSKIVLQDIPVLAIGQIVEQKEGKPTIVPTVTMDVTPEDAEKLAIASSQGRLQLVLRRVGDTAVAKTTGATITKVMAVSGTSVSHPKTRIVRRPRIKKEEEPVRAEMTHKPDVVSVDIWRGSAKSVETFKVEK